MKTRGKSTDKKLYYTWESFNNHCLLLATNIKHSGITFTDIYGIPRGGVPIAVRLSTLLDIPLTTEPHETTLVVDDVVDSGKTREQFPNNNFVSIHMKPWCCSRPNLYIEETNDWIIYPWELKN